MGLGDENEPNWIFTFLVITQDPDKIFQKLWCCFVRDFFRNIWWKKYVISSIRFHLTTILKLPCFLAENDPKKIDFGNYILLITFKIVKVLQPQNFFLILMISCLPTICFTKARILGHFLYLTVRKLSVWPLSSLLRGENGVSEGWVKDYVVYHLYAHYWIEILDSNSFMNRFLALKRANFND